MDTKFSKLRTFTNERFQVFIFININITSNDMPSWKGDEEQENVGGLRVRCSISRDCKVKSLDEMVGVYV
jgi:hypothetical protein